MVVRKTEHGLYAYNALGCRCEVCKKAMRRKNAARPSRKSTYITVQPLIDKFGDKFTKQYPGSLVKWLEGGITHRSIDRICVEYGYHPYEVYGDLWFEDIWEEMRKEKECESGNRSQPAFRTRARTVQR